MLFQEHWQAYGAEEHEVNYFTGTFIVDRATKTLGLIVAIKKKTGMIQVNITYHNKTFKKPLVTNEQLLTPVDFERFLSDLKTVIEAKVEKSQLHEVTYRRRTLDDSFSHFLDENEKEYLHQWYLLAIITGESRSETYDQINEHIRKLVATRV